MMPNNEQQWDDAFILEYITMLLSKKYIKELFLCTSGILL